MKKMLLVLASCMAMAATAQGADDGSAPKGPEKTPSSADVADVRPPAKSEGGKEAQALLKKQSADADGLYPGYRVAPLLRTSLTSAGQPIEYPRTGTPEVTALLVELPPGAQTGWHKHPYTVFGYVLSGRLTVELKDGRTNQFGAGEAAIEALNLLHNGKNTGTEPVRLLVFVTGETGRPFTIH